MKKNLILALVVAFGLVATSAMAASILGSKHDMNTGSAGKYVGTGTSADQVCIYCHTPHNAIQAVPLWNRATSATAVANYASTTPSTTLDHTLTTIPADSISGKCLSCHDGTIAPSSVVAGNVTASVVMITVSSGALLDDLDNDHPVGFTYSPSLDTDGPAGATSLDSVVNAEADGIKFFGAGAQVECASCHKVHDSAITPFLRTSNSGSAICLACHLK